ncbi:MAG: hypothetical protein WC985_10970 [Thermoplasmata archaeon]
MVDPRVIHSITIEMCTGFLLLAGTAVAVKVVSDWWLRNLRGHVNRFDKWALAASRFAEPASYFALIAGVLAAFLSMVTGSLAWPADQLWASETVHNKILVTSTSQTLFLGAVLLRARYRFEIWMTRGTGGFYALLVLTGDGLMVLQNSIAGHLAGKGSLMDDFLATMSIDTHPMWVFPAWASIVIMLAFPLAALLVGLRLRASAKRMRIQPVSA